MILPKTKSQRCGLIPFRKGNNWSDLFSNPSDDWICNSQFVTISRSTQLLCRATILIEYLKHSLCPSRNMKTVFKFCIRNLSIWNSTFFPCELKCNMLKVEEKINLGKMQNHCLIVFSFVLSRIVMPNESNDTLLNHCIL